MFGLFKEPDCPYCGSELEETGYSFPYPTHRCLVCIERNRKDKEIEALRKENARLKKSSEEPRNGKDGE